MHYNNFSNEIQKNAPFSNFGMTDERLALMVSWIFISENIISYCF